jgi:hypothetical protein
MPRRSLLLATAAFILLSSAGFAQTVEATLTGTVLDPSEAVIAGAVVTATEVNQGVTRTANTNEVGYYSIPDLKPGTYRISAAAGGFKTEVRTEVELQVKQTARLDFHLALGAVNDSVQVTAAGVALHTDDSTVGQVVQNRAVVGLPLNGRNYLELAQLTAGVAPANGSRTAASGGFAALGQHGYQTRVILDGVDNSSGGSGGQIGREAQAVTPSIDAVQEFKVVTNNNSAEYGFRMGGTVIVSTKAGTNQLHGTLFEFLRNDALDAANYFAAGQPKPPYRRNEFGGTVGGPVVKDRTFFFVAFDGTRTRQSQATISTVPTPAMLDGNFAGLNPIYDPLTTAKGSNGKNTRTLFPGNLIPTTRFDAVSSKVARVYPSPNLPGANNYYYAGSFSDNPNEVDSRLDHIFGNRNRAFVRYSRRWNDQSTPGPLPLPADGAAWTTLDLQANSLAADLNTTVSASVNNDFRLGYSTLNTNLGIPTSANLNAQYGVAGLQNFGAFNQQGLAAFVVNGFDSLGSKNSNPNRNNLDLYSLSDDLMKVHGRHTIKVGFGVLREGIYRKTAKAARGQLTFDGSYSNNPSAAAGTGSALADLLLGDAQKMQVSNLAGETVVTHNYSAYAQDDWRIFDKLTLNLGVRWDMFGAPSYGNSNVNIFQFTPGTQNYQILYPKDGGDCGCDRTWKNFAPRVGFAYQARPSTVIRSGFGVFYGQPDGIQDTSGRFFNQAPSFNNVTVNGDKAAQPALVVASGFPGSIVNTNVVPQNVGVNAAYRFMATQYAMQWFVDVQQQIARNSVATLTYIGSGTRHIGQSVNVNQPAPGPGTIASRSPFPFFNTISLNSPIANAGYNAFTAKFEQRYSKGLMVLGSYTWSHAIDNAVENLNGSTGQDPENYHDMRNQRGNSIFDLRHRFVGSVVYDLPFAAGKGPVRTAFGGWQVAGILNLYTGTPVAPIVSTDISNTGTTNRPNRIGSGVLDAGRRSVYQWFDLAAFTIPALYTYGNAGRNILFGPGTRNLDVKFGKSFPFRERWKLEFRAELFNAFNMPNFLAPNPNLDLPQGGQITAAKSARDIQLGMKLVF